MIKEIAHIGLTVSDLDTSIAFYRDVLGLRYQGKMTMSGESTDKLFEHKNCVAHVAYLNGSDEIYAPPIELIQFDNPTVTRASSSLFQTSVSEVCFAVKDIDATYNRLLSEGVAFISEPQLFDLTEQGFGKSKAVYFKDPDGIILELIESIQ